TGNFVSKVLGLIREGMIAALFGTGQTAGAFRIAQTGTYAPVHFLTGDALNSAFIPQYKAFRAVSVGRAQTFVGALFVLFGVAAALVTVALLFFAPAWVMLLAPGLDPATQRLAVSMLRIMGLGAPFYLVAALLIFLAMAEDDFRPMAVRPIIQNVGIIAGAVVAYFLGDARYFAWGFTVSQIVFCGWMCVASVRSQRLHIPERAEWPETRDVLLAFW